MSALMPDNCAVRMHSASGEPLGRCWSHVGRERWCPVHGDVAGVQYKFRETGKLTDDFLLAKFRREPPPRYGTEAWLDRFQRANPRAELVGFRGRSPLIKLKRADADFAKIFEVTGGTPESPTLQEV